MFRRVFEFDAHFQMSTYDLLGIRGDHMPSVLGKGQLSFLNSVEEQLHAIVAACSVVPAAILAAGTLKWGLAGEKRVTKRKIELVKKGKRQFEIKKENVAQNRKIDMLIKIVKMHLRHDAETPDVARLIVADALVVARSERGNNFGRHELGRANRGAHAE